MSNAAMDWHTPLQLTKNFFIQPLGMHSYAARASFASDRGVQLDAGTIALVSCFTQPCTPRAAREALGATVESSDFDFFATITMLVEHGVLRDTRAHSGSGEPIAGSGYAHALVHHGMLLDAARVDAYRLAIARRAPKRRVLEIGCGSGVLSIFAARYGAAEVVALEESGAVTIARALALENGVGDDISFVVGNSLDYQPEEKAEVIIHELIGHEPFAEHALRYLEDARLRLLAPGGLMIPSGIEVRCRAIGRSRWQDRRRLRAEVDEIGSRCGLSLTPFLESLEATAPLPTFERAVEPTVGGAVTSDITLYDVDFSRPVAEQGVAEPVEVLVPVERDGFVNALVVHFRARLDENLWLSNAPEAPRTHWALAVYDLPEPREVTAGEQLVVRSRLEPIGGVERMMVTLAPSDGDH